jgi:hypothetical protein
MCATSTSCTVWYTNSLTYLEPSARSFRTYSCSSGALQDSSDDLIVKKRTVKYTLPVPKEAAAAVNLANVTSGTVTHRRIIIL